MVIQQIKIDFNVTPQIKRYVFVYLIKTDTGCYLIDSGVAGSELMIEKAVIESGYHPSDIKAIFLTHAHPDHIGTASASLGSGRRKCIRIWNFIWMQL